MASENETNLSVVTFGTLSVMKALEIRDRALLFSQQYRLSGGIVVAGLRGEICAQVTDDQADPGTLLIARGKNQTVLNSGRSSSLQRDRILKLHYDRADYMGRMSSLFGGGVPIFLNPDRKGLIGSVAFSGGVWDEDEELSARAVVASGLYTDVEAYIREILDNRLKTL